MIEREIEKTERERESERDLLRREGVHVYRTVHNRLVHVHNSISL